MIIDYPWYYVLFCLLAGAAYAAGLYYVGRRRFGKGVNALLAALRFVAVSAIALLLLAPVAKRTVNEQQTPIVVVAQDVSESIDSTQLTVDSFLKGEPYEMVYETFGGTTTDIASELSDIASRYQGRNLGAVVLATDGIYNRGGNPATTAERLSFPVYTVALGDTTPQRDAALASVRHNRIAFLESTFPVEVTVNANRLKGQSALLTIVDGQGHKVAEQRVDYSDSRFSTTLAFSLKAAVAGLQKYTLHLSVVEGEKTITNNTQVFYTDVIDGHRKVAIIGNAPHPDLTALKQAVGSNPNYEAAVFLSDELRIKNEEWKDYSLVVLHNLPSATHQVPKECEGLPQVFVIGGQTDLPRFNALHTGLEIVSKVKKSSEVTAVFNGQFSLFTLEEGDGSAIEQLPPLSAPFGEGKMAVGLQSLFTARLGSIDSRQPLVAATTRGGQRRAFVWGEGLWKWRLGDYLNNNTHEHFDHVVSQIVNFTAVNDNRERFIVETDRHYAEGDEIVVSAQLYNANFEPVNGPDATFSLQGDSIKGDYNFSRRGSGYSLSLGALPEGLYHYTAATTFDGEKLTAQGSFAVEALHLEQANLTADHSLLATISAITGGKMYYPNELSALDAQLSTLKPVIYTHTRFSELLNLPWVLILIILLLGAEWVLRKYHGEV